MKSGRPERYTYFNVYLLLPTLPKTRSRGRFHFLQVCPLFCFYEEMLIVNKFRGNDPLGGGMKPFRVFESQWDMNKIVFIENDAFGGRKVWAEMHLIHRIKINFLTVFMVLS